MKKATLLMVIAVMLALVVGCSVATAPKPEATPMPKLNLTDYTFDETASLYNIYPLLEQKGCILCYAGYVSDDKLVTLHLSKSDDSCEYIVGEMDLEHGIYKSCFKTELKLGEYDDVSSMMFNVLSVKPLIFEDIYSEQLHMLSSDYSKEYVFDMAQKQLTGRFVDGNGNVYAIGNIDRTIYRISMETSEITPVFQVDYHYRYAALSGVTKDGKYITVTATSAYDEETRMSLLIDADEGKVIGQQAADSYNFNGKNDALVNVHVNAEWGEEVSNSKISIASIGSFDAEEMTANTYSLDGVYVPDTYINPDSEQIMFMTSSEGDISEHQDDYSLFRMSFYGDKVYSVTFDASTLIDKTESDDWSYPIIRPFACNSQGDMLVLLQKTAATTAVLLWKANDESLDTTITVKQTTEKLFTSELPQYVDYGEASEYARKIEEKYGVTILLGKNADISITNYKAKLCENKDDMMTALETIDKELEKYPKGFFETLEKDYLTDIIFTFIGKLSPKDESAISSAAALAYMAENYRVLAFNLDFVSCIDGNIHHEISHMIDGKLDSVALEDENMKWNCEEWNAMNPEGFTYNESYHDKDGSEYGVTGSMKYTPYAKEYNDDRDLDSIYFLDSYGKTFATEDRAMLFAQMFNNYALPRYMKSPHIIAKLEYFFNAIRYAFKADETWDGPASWETALEGIK